MPKLVTIINANGRRGKVAATYPPLVNGDLEIAEVQDEDLEPVEIPSPPPVVEELTPEVPVNLAAAAAMEADAEMPARNASTETWREYARTRPDSDLSSDEVEAFTRDEFVAHFHKEN